MKIIILSGPGEVVKRSEALRLKKQFSSDAIFTVDLKEDGLDKIEAVLTSQSLFEPERLVVVENTSDKLDLEKLPCGNEKTNLLIVAGTIKTDSILLQSAKKMGAKILSFEGEREVSAFPFLDSLLERKKQAFVELEKLLSEYGGIYILTMIYYGLRRNILPPPASSFAREKIAKQKKNYTLADFEKIYHLTLKTEFGIKNGTIPEKTGLVSLVQSIVGVSY